MDPATKEDLLQVKIEMLERMERSRPEMLERMESSRIETLERIEQVETRLLKEFRKWRFPTGPGSRPRRWACLHSRSAWNC